MWYRFGKCEKDSTLELVEVSFCGSASPEGGLALNRKLAEKRRNSLERYVRERISLPNGVISRPEGFIAWERLAELVEVSDMPHKEEALDVLRNVPEFTYNNKGVLVDSRKKRLMELQYGRTWRYMYKHFLPNPQCQCDSRDSPSKTSNRGKKVVKEEKEEPVVPAPADTTAVVEDEDTLVAVSPETSKPFCMALKTNMLYDVLTVLNIGGEFYLGKNWSISGNWMYGWWKRTAVTVTGASMAATFPCATGLVRRPVKSRLPDIM